jgi:hypothetical protein
MTKESGKERLFWTRVISGHDAVTYLAVVERRRETLQYRFWPKKLD